MPDQDEPDEHREGDETNVTLEDVLRLLESELERLKLELDNLRLSRHPQREALIRQLVQEIDLRQSRVDEIRDLILARDAKT